jgi:hypothetical protein
MGRRWPEIDRLKACYKLREQGVNFAVVWQVGQQNVRYKGPYLDSNGPQ